MRQKLLHIYMYICMYVQGFKKLTYQKNVMTFFKHQQIWIFRYDFNRAKNRLKLLLYTSSLYRHQMFQIQKPKEEIGSLGLIFYILSSKIQ